ncbi:endolytic transglycosylase MltG [Paenibacillus sp. YN15]|uniref:endolytic transglycosylase MltG n=1 Tax=Paenibacillus sp. YN15 TaxID=1742774 RepID=UPI000DCDD86A|nr:endolytic transglycosylase MltG [Paenibacillus sp. YN15]RAU96404.1 endolytic transglycosylase MltG [Paenibacillus sp. YN15]
MAEALEQNPKKRSGWKTALLILLILLLLGAMAAGGVGYYVYRSLLPMEAGEPVEVSIPSGTGSAAIAKLLEEQGIIKNGLIFSAYLKVKHEGDRFQAGNYQLAPGMTLAEITDKLNRGDVIKEEMIRFTIPEGYTVLQIAEKLAADGIVNKDSFLALANDSGKWTYPWITSIPSNAQLRYRLEGYLFPETYEMKKESTEQAILERMLAEWDKKQKSLPQGWEAQMDKLGLDLHGILTVASLVEREVAVDEERPLVAGVIYNRLKQKMPLQIDATVQYLFDKQKERLFEKDLQTQSPYNTYLNPGLPPGPIASPGLLSIKAALFPEETKYLFYVTKKDGSGGHLFAETFEEHKKNNAASKLEK